MYKNITFSQEEISALVTQIGTRLDQLKNVQVELGKKGDIERVLEMEEFMKPIRAGYQKFMDCL